MKLKAILAIALLVSASPAIGDWQYAKWGMTPDQLVAASNGKAELGNGSDGDGVENEQVGAVGTYESSEGPYRTVFYFRNGRLNQIVMQLKGDDTQTRCRSVLTNLKSTYGEPDPTSSDYITNWKDRAGANIVKLVNIDELCNVHFEQSGAHGLSL
jgi:hypothetical protein